MITALAIVHAIVSVLLILMVLIHFGKGAEAGLVLDAGASSILPQKGNVLNKITAVLAILFLSMSLMLATMRGKTIEKSIFDNKDIKTKTAAPVMPETPVIPAVPASSSSKNSSQNPSSGK
ncbi:MAG: preprotein translocase subunit SecG [Oligoflexia bacterium]|nr:preprotein translocase subunit SecG [Oligoflexia bacterium]